MEASATKQANPSLATTPTPQPAAMSCKTPTTPIATQDSDDCFHMISQLPWEDEVVWDGQEEAPKIMAKAGKRCQAAGWIPSAMHRRASDFSHQIRDHTRPPPQTADQQTNTATNQASQLGNSGRGAGGRAKHDKHNNSDGTDTFWYSIFPVDNEDLVYGTWERDIIWDPENTSHLPRRRFLTLDPNDENIIFQIPEDKPASSSQAASTTQLGRKSLANKKENLKRSKIVLNKSGAIIEPEIISPPPDDLFQSDKQPWNISNDEFYSHKAAPDVALKSNAHNIIQHSTPAVELRQPFFPTFMNRDRLREFHRPPLFPNSKRARANSVLANCKPHPVESLTQHIAQKAELREKKRLESGGGEMFFMHSAEDLSGKDAELILAECSEEYPPLLNQIGMATKVKNYARRKPGVLLADFQSEVEFRHKYGEPVIVSTSPFLGVLEPGQSLQTIENNMYRAPIYQHQIQPTDFLVIKSQDQYYIREVQTTFTVGQELPIMEVPGPNSKKANNFIRDFLQVYIYRMFWRSPLEPKRIKMDDIKKAFPSHSESSIRKRLKQCADFNRTGDNPNMWYLKKAGEFRLPQESEIRTMVSPEQCCAYYSMLAAERRLQDAGYVDRALCALEDDDDEDKQREMDDEVKTAPWNTTRAFIAAMKQKCLLEVRGVADPTGCGEGFSYVKIPNKPLLPKDEQVREPQPKKTVTGTDADLRRLKLSTAKNMLREYNIPEEKIAALPRWDVIHMVRELSTSKARAGEDALSKFARGNRHSIAENQEKYKENCQTIFGLQNRILASDEVLSTDDDDSNDEDDPEIEQGTKTLADAIDNKNERKTAQALEHESEEAQRRDLVSRMLSKQTEDTNSGDFTKAQHKRVDNMDESSNMGPPQPEVERILNIKRTYQDDSGHTYTRIETIRKPAVIETYLKIRQTKTAEEIREFAMSLDDPQREAKRKERKQIVRRRRMNHDKRSLGSIGEFGSFSRRDSPLETPRTTAPNSPSLFLDSDRSRINSISPDNTTIDSGQIVVRKRKEKDGSKLRCSACGGLGHMKNNRSCPAHPRSIKVAMTREELDENRASLNVADAIKTEGTKLVVKKSFIEKFERTERDSLKIVIPRDAIKRKRTSRTEDLDYLRRHYHNQPSRRRPREAE